MSNAKKILSLASIGGAAALGVAGWANAETHHFRLHEVTVPLLDAKVARRLGGEFTILHVSDLHMIPGQQEKIDFVNGLADLQPDLVINTGDNLSDVGAVPYTLEALRPLLSIPGLFVFGTNDYWAPRPVNPLKYLTRTKREPSYVDLPWQGMRAFFQEHGWMDATHKRHEFVASGLRIAAAGVDDPHHDLDDYSTIAGTPHPDADLAIALTHSPEPRVLEKFAADGYDVAFAGHTHGGQVCLPGGRAIVTNCEIDPARASGLSEFDGMALHVSNGLGTSKFAPVRLFCKPSATLLRIVAK
ncbi:phosphohydrolase [Corynebacterium renale]|uniref:metallophosphoesterase n=1 Tax=Corynebacterium renale TaxID=1724 RepID=UPI000DA28262|nr:phosphohydrolase [Corynebacterium renale]STD02381.1 phosphohydrolase [Corynebacterium renale]